MISAAKSTNALILTGGSNTGAMKLVGEAVRDGQYMIQVKLVPSIKERDSLYWPIDVM